MNYHIKALDRRAEVVELTLEADNPPEARRMAEDQGLRVLSLRLKRQLWRRRQGRDAFPLVLFSQELSTLLNAGLALIDALESLAEKESAEQAGQMLNKLVRLLYEGKSFSQALSRFPGVFPAVYVALVQSSEETGSVSDALSRYVAYRRRLDELRQKIISAAVYPLLLLCVGGGVLLFLLGYVVPRFSLVFEGLDSSLPWLSRVLMNAGLFLHEHQIQLFSALLAAIVGLVILIRQPGFRRFVGRQLQRVPSIHQRLFLYELARFYRSLGILLQGGIPILTALDMARGLLGGEAQQRLAGATTLIREGHALSSALQSQQLSTPVSVRMLRAGEQAGNLGQMMERTADFYDEEISRWIDWFVRLFEPLLMTFIGLLIGVIVILMYIPIFELASSIQ